jgi:putative ABC transport system permease protein
MNLGSTLARILNSFRKSPDQDLHAELNTHLQLHIQDNLSQGMSLEEARRQALLKLGGLEQTKEAVRDQHSLPLFESLFQDLRFAARLFRKSPGFMAIAILTLAVGIGATSSIFTLINSILLRPLSYPQADRIVQVDLQYKDGSVYYGMSHAQFRSYQQQNQAFQYLAAYDLFGSGLNLSSRPEPELIQSRRVTADFFRVLGVTPALGRDFATGDDRPGAAPVVILSYRVWKNLLDGSPVAIGAPVRLGGELYTVIGVTPPNFAFSRDTQAWIPLRNTFDPTDRSKAYRVLGRLRSGVSVDFAKQGLNAINPQLHQAYPELFDPNELGVLVTAYQDRVVGDVRPVLLLLAAAVACVLLIACSNVASLLLARAVNRRKEIAVRAALGVTPARLIRQLLTESTLLSLAGGAAGLFLTQWGVRIFTGLFASDIPRQTTVAIDLRVLFFTVLLSLLTGLLFGSAPAFQLGRVNAIDALRDSGRSTASTSTRRIQGILVSLEICLATVLLLAAGLLISSLSRILQVAPGFDPQHVLALQTSFTGPSFSSTSQVDLMAQKAIRRLQTVPGIQSAAASTFIPTEASLQNRLEIPSLPPGQRPGPDTFIQWRAVTPAYFETLRVPVLQGRSFNESDTYTSAPVAIVNEAFLRQFLSQRLSDVIGLEVLLGRESGPQFRDTGRQIVGVIADSHELGLDQSAAPAVYIPFSQVPDTLMAFLNRALPVDWLVRVSGEPLAYAPAVHKEFFSVDPNLVPSNPRSLSQVLSASLSGHQTETALLTFFSITALLLGALGLYGILAYSVAQRKQEIGIRMALGANRAHIHRLVIVQGLRLTLLGLFSGILLAWLLSRFLRAFLFGISSADSFTVAAVATILLIVALAACLLPARRASQLDPNTALRYE